MTEPIAYCRGEWVAASQAGVPLADAGFVLGATVSEQLRTFNGRLFLWDEHVARMQGSLAPLGLTEQVDFARLNVLVEELLAHNYPLIPPTADLGVAMLVTPGWYPAFALGAAPSGASGPHIYLHSYPLPFARWAKSYTEGVRVVASRVPHPSAETLPRQIKSRSRLHYHLADLDAERREAGSRALWLDADGSVLETSTSNVVLCFERVGKLPLLVTPPGDSVLPGVSLHFVCELAKSLGWSAEERRFPTSEITLASEMWATSTPFCAVPITSFDGNAVGSGKPGPRFRELMSAWNDRVGLDVIAQAQRAASA